MLYGFTKHSINNIHNSLFYVLSCVANMAIVSFAYFTVPVIGIYITLAVNSTMAVLLVEFIVRKYLSDKQYNVRYSLQIMCGVLSVSFGMFYVKDDYILYLPILLGMMYLTVNTILKSLLVQYASIAFMFSSALKVVITQPPHMLKYLSVIALFVVVVLMTSVIFRTNKEQLEESERATALMRGMHHTSTHQTNHDMRNLLQEMQVLATPKYRNDTVVFLEKLHGFSERIEALVANDVFDNIGPVSITEVVDSLSHLTTNKHVIFSFVSDDDAPVHSVRKVVNSVMHNLVENSIEAAMRRGIQAHVVVVKSANKITVTDNCGGFDIGGITSGYTSKVKDPKKHGIFLRFLTDPTTSCLFGFSVKLQRLEDGTRTVLTFTQPKA